MADSNLKCNTCNQVRFADVITSFVLVLSTTLAGRAHHHCQPDPATLHRTRHSTSAGALSEHHQPGGGAQRRSQRKLRQPTCTASMPAAKALREARKKTAPGWHLVAPGAVLPAPALVSRASCVDTCSLVPQRP